MTTSVPQRPAFSLDELAIENSYTSLPASFYTRLQPTPLSSPYMVCGSASAAALIGLDPAEFSRQDFIDAVSHFRGMRCRVETSGRTPTVRVVRDFAAIRAARQGNMS